MVLKRISLALGLALALGLTGCDSSGEGQANFTYGGDGFSGLNTEMDSVSYGLGVDIAKSFQQQGWEINGDAMHAGFSDASAGGELLLTHDQARQIIMNFQRAKQQEVQQEQGAANQAAGDAYLAENKGKPGVKVLPSGLQYEVMAEGSGASPTLDDQVRIHYKGTLLDGTVFDSSYERGEPAVFQPRGLIKAWQEILPMMKPGAKYKIVSPPDLAYGPMGSPPRIGPNSTLIFEMELFEVIKN